MATGIIPGAPADPMDGAAEFPDDTEIVSNEGPLSERLNYTSPLHKELIAKLIQIRDVAAEPIEDMHEEWNRVDEHMGLHVDLRRSSVKGDGTLDTTRKEIPFEKSLVVPVSFSVEKVIQAQLNSIFTGRDPQFQYDGGGPEDVAGAKLMEVTVGYDLRKSNFGQVSSQAIQNSLRYGLGPVHLYWYEDFGYMQKPMVQGPMAEVLGATMPDLIRPMRQWGLRCAHVQHQAIDPYKFRIDPRKSLSTFQKGDIIGHEFTESLLYFKSRKLSKGEGPYFNCEQLEKSGFGSGYRRSGTNRSHGDEPGRSNDENIQETQNYHTEHLEIRLIPKEWKLGDGDKPEIWWFEWCGDDVIVRAHASPYDHGKFNYGVGAAYPDQNVILPMGMGQMIDPFQRFMTWMASSRFENVRRFINNAALIMTDYVEVADIMNPKPAGHIRLKQAAMDLIAQGLVSDARIFYPQLALQDVTGAHMQDIQQLFEWVGRMTGANDLSQGVHLPSKRTATEIDKLSGSASQRTQSMAEDMDNGLFGPLAELHSMIRQQYSTDEQWHRINGDMALEIEQRIDAKDMIKRHGSGIHVKIAPWDLYGEYDYIPYTGMDANNPARSVENMLQLMQVTSGIPQLNDPMMAMQMGEEEIADLKKFVLRIGENMGIKDVGRLFKKNPMIQVMQDQQLAAQQQAGNVVPVSQV
jgi:hypothetical protein